MNSVLLYKAIHQNTNFQFILNIVIFFYWLESKLQIWRERERGGGRGTCNRRELKRWHWKTLALERASTASVWRWFAAMEQSSLKTRLAATAVLVDLGCQSPPIASGFSNSWPALPMHKGEPRLEKWNQKRKR